MCQQYIDPGFWNSHLDSPTESNRLGNWSSDCNQEAVE